MTVPVFLPLLASFVPGIDSEMLGITRHLRRPLIALAAIAAALFATSDASACSTMKQSQRACATVCGYCTSARGDNPAPRAEGAASVVSPHAAAVSGTAPAKECSCRSQEPAAPSPKPARRSAEDRPELNEGSAYVQPGEAFDARTVTAPQAPPTQSPPKAPLYLRNERLRF